VAEIRDLEKFAQGRWRWDEFGYSSAFPRGISPGDIDAFLEVNGRFLFIEHKQYVPEDGPPLKMPTGQKLALERLAQQPSTTVLYIAGDAVDCSPWWIRNLTTGDITDLRDTPDPGYRTDVLTLWLHSWCREAS